MRDVWGCVCVSDAKRCGCRHRSRSVCCRTYLYRMWLVCFWTSSRLFVRRFVSLAPRLLSRDQISRTCLFVLVLLPMLFFLNCSCPYSCHHSHSVQTPSGRHARAHDGALRAPVRSEQRHGGVPPARGQANHVPGGASCVGKDPSQDHQNW